MAPSRIEIRHWLATLEVRDIEKRLAKIECPLTQRDVRDFLNLEYRLHRKPPQRGKEKYPTYSLVTEGEHDLYLEQQKRKEHIAWA